MQDYRLELIEYNDLRVLASPKLLRERPIRFFFTTRDGGVSRGKYASLNMADHVGDDAESVKQNRIIACDALGLNPSHFVTVRQVHGKDVVDACLTDRIDPAVAADAIVTRAPDVAVAIMTADCVPIILIDNKSSSAAVVHAGFKGLYLEIVVAAVERLTAAGSRPSDIIAFVGPCIRECCYQVDEQRAALFDPSRVRKDGGRLFLDLAGAAEDSLRRAGIGKDAIVDSGLCTACRPDLFYSYRRDGDCGRQAAIAVIDGA